MSKPQSAASHAKMVPMYHYVTFALILVPTVYMIVGAVRSFSVAAVMNAAFAVGVIFVMFWARIFALGAQDRVIRLEERLRLARVLPADMHDSIEQISTEHLIGLRFASDGELEELTRRILAGDLADRKAVKLAVKTWRADHQRI